MQQLWKLPRKILRLHDDGGDDHRGDGDQCRDDEEIDDEDGRPPRNPLSNQPLSFELVDER